MKIHFVGIGTGVMCNLAVALIEDGFQVTGSDDEFLDNSKYLLEKSGVLNGNVGWFPNKIIQNIDAVVVGNHVKSSNPELEKAKTLGLNIYSYSEFLYWLSKDKTRIVVTGTRGKYIIVSIVLHVIDFYDRDVDFVVGTQSSDSRIKAKLSKESDFILLEGGEYILGKEDLKPDFLLYKPNIALISDIEQENINTPEAFGKYINKFQEFVNSITAGGVIIYNQEDVEVVKIIENTSNYLRKIPYKTPNHEIINNQINLLTDMGKIPLDLTIFDIDNLQNVEAARHLCQQLGVMEEEFYEAIMSFKSLGV